MSRKVFSVLVKLAIIELQDFSNRNYWQVKLYEFLFREAYTYSDALKDMKRLRCLQLHVQLFNEAHSYIIFVLKSLCLSLCILNGYAAIAHFSEHPVFSIMYCIVWPSLLTLYTVVYDKAFGVKTKFDQTVQSVLFRLQQEGIGIAMAGRYLKSISLQGIKVGEFHVLERASTPIFIDYVAKNIVNMLVGYM